MSVDLGNGDFMGTSFHNNEKKVLEEKNFILKEKIVKLKIQNTDLIEKITFLENEARENDKRIKEKDKKIKNLENKLLLSITDKNNFTDYDRECGFNL